VLTEKRLWSLLRQRETQRWNGGREGEEIDFAFSMALEPGGLF
jgi:hypothetical protein